MLIVAEFDYHAEPKKWETRVQLCIVGGSLDLSRYVSVFRVRQRVVLDLCERLIAKGHPDVRALSRAEMHLRAQQLPEYGIPECTAHLLLGE